MELLDCAIRWDVSFDDDVRHLFAKLTCPNGSVCFCSSYAQFARTRVVFVRYEEEGETPKHLIFLWNNLLSLLIACAFALLLWLLDLCNFGWVRLWSAGLRTRG